MQGKKQVKLYMWNLGI